MCQKVYFFTISLQALVDEIVLADDATMDTLEMASDQLISAQEYYDISSDEFRVCT